MGKLLSENDFMFKINIFKILEKKNIWLKFQN